MKPSEYFHFCPRCGVQQAAPPAGNSFTCAACGFTFFFSAANATAAFVRRDDGRVLFIRRAKEPAKGKLAPPGGFVDIGETAEDAVRREIREEVGLELTEIQFLCSHPNLYPYRDVSYPVLDFFFCARAVAAEQAKALDDVASFCWLDLSEVSLEEIAFPSMRAALEQLRVARSAT
ncbi:MAG: NUDIX domain-containing protein [Verrucomicrobia bacterium]|nr:NUDIX domain-containing protein [Verrucomicrobiota bacterium]